MADANVADANVADANVADAASVGWHKMDQLLAASAAQLDLDENASSVHPK